MIVRIKKKSTAIGEKNKVKSPKQANNNNNNKKKSFLNNVEIVGFRIKYIKNCSDFTRLKLFLSFM